jgi:hypothetical protein
MAKIKARLGAEVEVLRWCIDWLEQLETQDFVAVNLRTDTEKETEFVPFRRPRVFRVLSRIAADLEHLARQSSAEILPPDDDEEPRKKHLHRLAEPEPTPKRLTMREERLALRKACGLPPYPTHDEYHNF